MNEDERNELEATGIKCPEKEHPKPAKEDVYANTPAVPSPEELERRRVEAEQQAYEQAAQCPWCKHKGTGYQIATFIDSRLNLEFITVACQKCRNIITVNALPVAAPPPMPVSLDGGHKW